jgi:hypothetical protein
MIVQGSFREWLVSVSPPPLKVRGRSTLTPDELAEREMTNRRIIDPRKINQFIDPEREGNA